MEKIDNGLDTEIEFRVYSSGEYVDLFSFNRVLGELVWKALAEIAETGDIQPLASMCQHNRQSRASQFAGMNFWERFVSEVVQKKAPPLNDYVDAGRMRQFLHEMKAQAEGEKMIVYLLPSPSQIQHIQLSDRRGALTTVLRIVVKFTRKRYLKMCHGYPSPERRAYFKRLYEVFSIPSSGQRAFNRSLCRIINEVTEGYNQ